jgi:signal transduction histidine kinase
MSAVVMANWPRLTAMSGGSQHHQLARSAQGDVQRLDLCALAQHAVALLRARGYWLEHEVRLELPTEPVFAWVSQRRMEQVLHHLLVHALDESQGEGAVARSTRLTVEPPDDFGDHGPTFRVRYLGKRVSERREAGGEELARGTPRTGLSQARELVESMGGQLTVRGRGLTGATVSVELPDQGTASW